MSARRSLGQRWRRRRRARRLRALRLPYRFWHHRLQELHSVRHLNPAQRRRLRILCGEFLAGKRFVGARGFPVDDRMRLLIAILACLPALELGLSALRNVRDVVIYSGTFLVDREGEDEAGVVHSEQAEMAGEAWEQGPVILSWGDFVAHAASQGLDEGLVLHEFVHKLDMLSGSANGMPPLHRDMDGRAWSGDFQQAYDALCDEVDRGMEPALDPYGAQSPAEFFSVSCEAFFLAPQTLREAYPAVYAQLAAFFRQDPLAPAGTAPGFSP
jgi:Mlc titration factor MtfA (ptsG expression regulator)